MSKDNKQYEIKIRSLREAVYANPSRYIGSINQTSTNVWIYNDKKKIMINKKIKFSSGLINAISEIIYNAVDQYYRTKIEKEKYNKVTLIKIFINEKNGEISVYNNGRGLDIKKYQNSDKYIPEIVFGTFLSSSAYDEKKIRILGGLHGEGAKITNTLSKYMIIETVDANTEQKYIQKFENNLKKINLPKITKSKEKPYTLITFLPDYEHFNNSIINKNLIKLLETKAYGIAANTGTDVKIYFNNEHIKIKTFKDYVEFFISEQKVFYTNFKEKIQDDKYEEWEIAIANNNSNEFQQISFVNTVLTREGGSHVDIILKKILFYIMKKLRSKFKELVINERVVKDSLFLFIKLRMANPFFEGQTKEKLVKPAEGFKSKIDFAKSFITNITSDNFLQNIYDKLKSTNIQQLGKMTSRSKSKILSIPKLRDAENARKKNHDATLIITEGDSATSAVLSGLSAIGGTKKYGIYPIRGKILNVYKDKQSKKMDKNIELKNLLTILGIRIGINYNDEKNFKQIRYQNGIHILTDQDVDGFHIRGLIIAFFSKFFPSLIQRNDFIKIVNTPIIKIIPQKKSDILREFFHIESFQNWLIKNKINIHKIKIKYFKGLGTNTQDDMRRYFKNLENLIQQYLWKDKSDTDTIEVAFDEGYTNERKDLIKLYEKKITTEKNLIDIEKLVNEKKFTNEIENISHKDAKIKKLTAVDTLPKTMRYYEFITTELIQFSFEDVQRSIPSMIDGLKPSQRKVIEVLLKSPTSVEKRVSQWGGIISNEMLYHHGEKSLEETIIHLAQDFVGSNNINLLQPEGQFGSRISGGKDHAQSRYINTRATELSKIIFNKKDNILLNYQEEDGDKIEPKFFIPILPMILVNGARGIGTGYATNIPNYNPEDLIQIILNFIDKNKNIYDLIKKIKPFYKGFTGEIKLIKNKKSFYTIGIGTLLHNKLIITELPIQEWTDTYKEKVLIPLLYQGKSEKGKKGIIRDIVEKNKKDTNFIEFHIELIPKSIKKLSPKKILSLFKLKKLHTLNNFVAFDTKNEIKTYKGVGEILDEWLPFRLNYYILRKEAELFNLLRQKLILKNKINFIQGIINKSLNIGNKTKIIISEILKKNKFDTLNDIISKTNKFLKTALVLTIDDYDYLLRMQIYSLTKEEKDRLQNEYDRINSEYNILNKKNPEDLWKEDLIEFKKNYITK